MLKLLTVLLVLVTLPVTAICVDGYWENSDTYVKLTLNEIWEVLQIVENRLPRSLHGFTIDVYDPCVEDQICMAKREVERLEREKEENEKIKKLIEKFRKGFVR